MVQILNRTLADGGPDGNYLLPHTARGTIGFSALHSWAGSFIGQAHHITSGPKHYDDTINFVIRPSASGSTIKAFSMSLIAGALGDNGQTYKNIIMAMKSGSWKAPFQCVHVDDSCQAGDSHHDVCAPAGTQIQTVD